MPRLDPYPSQEVSINTDEFKPYVEKLRINVDHYHSQEVTVNTDEGKPYGDKQTTNAYITPP